MVKTLSCMALVLSLVAFFTLEYTFAADKQQFCNNYADTAVKQYNLGIQNNLPGIVPPAWSNDRNGHFNWCMAVPENFANGEDDKRQTYLDENIKQTAPSNKEVFCNAYTDVAIKQYNQAKQLFDPKGPAWSNDRNSHYNWCLHVPENFANSEKSKRQKLIDDFINSTQPETKQDPDKITKYKYVKIAKLPDLSQIIKIKEDTCRNYAKESIRLIKLDRSKRCYSNIDNGEGYYNWDRNFSTYKEWCMSLDDYLYANKVLAEKIKKLKTCRGLHTIWVPGMVIGLRHSINNNNDEFIPSDNYSHYHDNKLIENSITDFEISSDINPQFLKQWRFYTVIDGDFPEAYQYILPPGIVINLRGRYIQHIIEFGFKKQDIKSYYDVGHPDVDLSGPDYYGGGKFHKEIGGDLGDKAGFGLNWYESTGLGFKDWSQVKNLPRGTVIGLKHSLNQPDKKLIWQGVVYDPVNPNVEPPPGFARKEGGDLGAPAGEGFFWYEKITGQ